MSSIKRFEDTDAWRQARELSKLAYRLTRRSPLSRDFDLVSQLRRAAVSSMNNIAEGWESVHAAEKTNFFGYARRSCGEVRSMSYVLIDNDYCSEEEATALYAQADRVVQLVSGLMRSTNRRTREA
jgi:four helix bundle protein